MLQKRHFQALATAIKGSGIPKRIAKEISDICKRENDLFDEERFIDACGFYGRKE